MRRTVGGLARALRDAIEGAPLGRAEPLFEQGLRGRAALGMALATFGAWAALQAPWSAALPEVARLGLALFALVVGPGYAFVALGAVPPGGLWLAPMWALACGVLFDVALLAGGGFTGPGGLDRWERAWPVAAGVLWAGALLRPGDRPAERAARPRETLSAAPWALAVVLVAAVLAGVHAGMLGTPVTYYGDSPDHIGTVRRIVETGNPFPADAFFRDAGALGTDPRKGWWHALVGAVARLAQVDAAATWIGLSAWIAPLFVLNAAALGWVAWGPAGAAVTAAMLFVLWAGNLQWFPLRKAVFGTFLADQMALAAVVGLLWDLARGRRVTRLAAALLAASAVATHVYAAFQFAVALGGFAVLLWARERGAGPAARRVAVTLAAMAAPSAAVLAARMGMLHPTTNVIHTEPQGLLVLAGDLRVVSPGVLWDWMGTLWVLFPLCAVWLWSRRWNPVALYALAVPLAVALVMFNPLAVALLEPRVGYLLMRMVWMLPLAGLLGWAFVMLARDLRARRGAARAGVAVALAGLAAWVAPVARDAASTLTDPGAYLAGERRIGLLQWRAPLEWMDRHLPDGQVVLSDPATSYAVPMLTRHYVATLVDQHSSPSDSLALRRILDARDALDPYGSWARTREVVARHGVTVVVLNGRFSEIPKLSYWAPAPGWFAAARARLDAAPGAFEPVFDEGDFVVYRVRRAALDTLAAPPVPRPFVRPYVPGRFPVARRLEPGAPALHRLGLGARRAARGDTVRAVAEWRATTPLPAGSWRVSVRFDRDLPAGFAPPAWIGKPARKLLERARGERYRFRADHLPVDGAYGVDLWRPDEVVRDSFAFVVPPDVAPGAYRVEIALYRQPHYANYRLADYFFDRDYYSGLRAGTLEVLPAGAAAAGGR